jgi:PAS domain-containing protein
MLAATDPSGSGESPHCPPIGAERWVATHGRPSSRTPLQSSSVVRDVAERWRTEAELRRLNEERGARRRAHARARPRSGLSRDLMVVKRLDSTPVALNPAWQEMLGWREDELMAGRLVDLVHPGAIANR